MRRFTETPLYILGGVVVGVISAYVAIQHLGVASVKPGTPWLSRAEGLSGNSSFYVRSSYLLDGRLPPAPGQMIEAMADTDSEGRALSISCSYEITSIGPIPRWWSLAALGSGKRGGSRQSIVDSDSAIIESDGSIRVVAAALPQPGNWLKQPGSRSFSLLYSATPAGSRLDERIPPFRITQSGC